MTAITRPIKVVLSCDPNNSAHSLFADAFDKLMRPIAPNVDIRPYHSLSDVRGESDEFLREAEVLVLSPFAGSDPVQAAKMAAKMAESSGKLRWIHTFSTGVDALMPLMHQGEELRSRIVSAPSGAPKNFIPITNARGASSENLAEFAIASMLYFNKSIPRLKRNQAERSWDKFLMSTFRGKTVGLLGFGGIGREVGRMASALGLNVQALRRRVNADGCNVTFPYSAVPSADALFATSDFVVCSLPGTPETEGIVSASVLSTMKDGLVFVNVGRGSVVDEEALVRFSHKHAADPAQPSFGGLALDVFRNEPLPKDSPLWATAPDALGCEAIISPHNADSTDDWAHLSVAVFVDRLREYGEHTEAGVSDIVRFGEYEVDLLNGY